jgi:hypothetical protein
LCDRLTYAAASPRGDIRYCRDPVADVTPDLGHDHVLSDLAGC